MIQFWVNVLRNGTTEWAGRFGPNRKQDEDVGYVGIYERKGCSAKWYEFRQCWWKSDEVVAIIYYETTEPA